MSNRRHRTSEPISPEGEERSDQAAGSAAPSPPRDAAPAGKGKSPFRMMFVIWGLPLIFFIVVAIVKECGS